MTEEIHSFRIAGDDPWLVEGNTRSCAECKIPLEVGDESFYRFDEDDDFCSEECILAWERKEAHTH